MTSSIHIKGPDTATPPVIPELVGGGRRILVAYWPGHLAKTVSSVFREKFYLKKKVETHRGRR